MSEKVIGILGGMGPEATLDCFGKIIRSTPARIDQEHLRVIIDSNPKVPDRTAAIVGNGDSPVPVLIEGVRSLERAGADFIIMPCVSAHFFIASVQSAVQLPFLSIFDAVASVINREHPDIEKVGLLSTTGTVKGGLFQKRLAEGGLETLVPTDTIQETVMSAIYAIKDVRTNRSREEITSDLVNAAGSLVERGAQGIIAGCTEIPLALRQENLDLPYFDSLLILAREAVRYAGLEPISNFESGSNYI